MAVWPATLARVTAKSTMQVAAAAMARSFPLDLSRTTAAGSVDVYTGWLAGIKLSNAHRMARVSPKCNLFYFHLPGPTDSFVVQHAGNGLQPGSAHGCKWMSHPPPTAQASCGPPAFHSIPFSCSVLATLLRPDSADAVRPQLRSNTCQETNLSMSQISGASTTASCLCTYVALSTAARYSADPSSRGQFSPGSSDKSYATGVGKME